MNLATMLDWHPGDAGALTSTGETTTYGSLRQQVDGVRGGLMAAGVLPGDRVALVLASNWFFVVAHYAALGAGAVVVPLNPQSPAAELQRELDTVQPRCVIVGPAGRAAFAGVDRAAAGIEMVFVPEGVSLPDIRSFEDLLVADPVPVVDRSPDDLALLMFTSGTAGSPRAAQLTHGNLLANLKQMQAGESTLRADDINFCVIPLSHIYGLNAALNLTFYAGARIVLVQRFDPVSALQSIRDHKVTVVAGVPPMYGAWVALTEESAPADSLLSVRLAASGASRLDPALAVQFRDRFGVGISEGYGLTEASPAVTAASFPSPRFGTVGAPLPGVDVRVVDDDGDDVLEGDPGEIWVRGPNVFTGYWHDLEATQRALTADGWLRTGDIAIVDERGELTIVDRAKDLIIVSGFNVFPGEVEDVLKTHPGIEDAAVIGMPHPHTGESVKALVVPKADRLLDEDEVIEFCSEQLARYKCPSKVLVVNHLPRGSAGKLLRRELA